MNFSNSKKGSMTLEAALVLPIFLSSVLAVMFIIKLVYVHEIIGHALIKSADEIAGVSYIYAVSGLGGTVDGLQDAMEGKAENKGETLKGVLDSLGDLNSESLPQVSEDISKAPDSPLEELKGAAWLLSAGAVDDIRSELFIPLAKASVEKNLAGNSQEGADKRLAGLNVVGGLKGLDFSESSFLEKDSEDIDLVVTYKVNIPVPFKIIPDIRMTQRATVKAWLYGDEGFKPTENGESVWNLTNFDRGDRLRSQFGGNLPKTFPVIAGFSGGTAMMIKSMDLTTPYYQSAANTEEKLKGYIRELAKFKGTEWGNITIEEKQISSRHLKLIIPENELGSSIAGALEKCGQYARQNNVELEVIRYQYKTVKEEEESSEKE